MKYLRKFNESILPPEEISEICKTLEEICLELKDEGFEIIVKEPYLVWQSRFDIEVKIINKKFYNKGKNSNKQIIIEYTQEYIDRMTDYMNSKGLELRSLSTLNFGTQLRITFNFIDNK